MNIEEMDTRKRIGLAFLVASLPFLILSFIFDIFKFSEFMYSLFLFVGLLCFLIGTFLAKCRVVKDKEGGEKNGI